MLALSLPRGEMLALDTKCELVRNAKDVSRGFAMRINTIPFAIGSEKCEMLALSSYMGP